MPIYKAGNREREAFIEFVIQRDLIDEALDWIAQNLSPENVFPKDLLEQWAEDNGYKKDN